MRVAVCCVTYHRPDGLRRLLEALNALVFVKSPAPEITVFVVDNDRAGSARTIVDAIRPQFRWNLQYDLERARGVASARNRCLALVPPEAERIAMIDDDEVPVPEWLDELLDVARRCGAEFVQGPVEPEFAAPPPEWLRRGRFLAIGPFPDGSPLGFGYSGNVLMDAAAVRAAQLRFDEAFDLTGGEDQRFFDLALRKGLRIVTSERAVIREHAPAARTTLRYLLRRRFRMGNTLGRIDRMEGGLGRIAARLGKSLGRLGVGLVQSVALIPRGAAGPVAGLCNLAWGAGALAGLTGLAYEEYGHPRATAVSTPFVPAAPLPSRQSGTREQ